MGSQICAPEWTKKAYEGVNPPNSINSHTPHILFISPPTLNFLTIHFFNTNSQTLQSSFVNGPPHESHSYSFPLPFSSSCSINPISLTNININPCSFFSGVTSV